MKKKFILLSIMVFIIGVLTEHRSEASNPIYQASKSLLTENGAHRLIITELNQRYGKQGWKVSWVRQWATRITFVANGVKKGPVYTPGRTKVGWIDNRIKTSSRGAARLRIKGYLPRTPTGLPMR